MPIFHACHFPFFSNSIYSVHILKLKNVITLIESNNLLQNHCRCDNPSMMDIRAVLSASRFAVKTLIAKNLRSNITILPEKTFKNGSVYELKIDGSSLEDMKENAFDGTTKSLQTLSLHNGKLTSVPRAIGKISSLKRLSLQSNRIHDIYAYAFFSQSKLAYLNLKDNRLETMAENAFLGMWKEFAK